MKTSKEELLKKCMEEIQKKFYDELGPLSRICKEVRVSFEYGEAHIVFTSKKEDA